MRRGELPPPRFLIDRSLGVRLREAVLERGYEVYTLRTEYTEQGAQIVDDTKWIDDAAKAGRIILTKDNRIRWNPLEKKAMRDAKARGFCLGNGQVSGAEMRRIYLLHLNRIIQRSRKPGPYMYGVYPEGLRLLWPKAPEDLDF
jgi:predicted nuclease of predicted toxin-antitoxin system